MALPTTTVERVERRYRAASSTLDAWRTAAHAAVEAEYQLRAAAVLADRDRDFQVRGLGVGGQSDGSGGAA